MYRMANKTTLCVVLLTFIVRSDGQLIEGKVTNSFLLGYNA